MKKILLSLVLLVGLTLSTQATMIDLGWTGGQPASVAAELGRLNGQIGLWNLSNDPDLTLATSPLWSGFQTQTPDSPKSITLNLSGFEGYLLFKYGPVDRFFYLNDNLQTLSAWSIPSVSYLGDGNYTFLSDVYNFGAGGFDAGSFSLPPTAGLSHYTTFSTVPETGTWVTGLALFLPFALSTMKIFRRYDYSA